MNEKFEKTEEIMTIDKLATMMMDGFAHLNTKFDTRIDNLERKMNNRFDMVIARLDDQEVRKISRPEFKALDKRVEVLENVPKTA